MRDDDRLAPEADDAAYMRRALALAARGWGQTAPNPLVGAVVVRDGQVVGEGWHERFGEPHAEVMALRAAGERARGATMYVTLEPCTHVGKTPACTTALVGSGLRRVVIAAHDPNPRAAGGATLLREAGIDVTDGVERQRALELNAPFFHSFVSDRPWVTLKLALSIDGAIAGATRARGWLTGPESRAEVHRMRAGVDAIAVGIGTALADDPALTVREVAPPRVAPMRVVFDSTARLPIDSALARTASATPTLVVASRPDAARAAALRARGVEVLEAATMHDALVALRSRGVLSMLVEGGAGMTASLVAGRLVDRVVIFRAPVVLGAGALNPFAELPPSTAEEAERWRIVERRTFGDDEMTTYAVRSG